MNPRSRPRLSSGRSPVGPAVRAVRFHGDECTQRPGRPRPTFRGRQQRIEIRVSMPNAFGARASLGAGLPDIYRLSALRRRACLSADLGRAPVTLKILLENALRHAGGGIVREEDVATLAAWRPGASGEAEVPFMPARVVLQDFTGVPAVVDLAVDARRDGRPRRRPVAREPARAGGPRHRPLGPGRRLGRRRRLRAQRGARVRAQRRAIPAAALGPDRVPRPARGARPARASSTRSTSSSWRPSWPTGRTRRAGWRSPTRSSGPTHTRR